MKGNRRPLGHLSVLFKAFRKRGGGSDADLTSSVNLVRRSKSPAAMLRRIIVRLLQVCKSEDAWLPARERPQGRLASKQASA